MKRQKKQTSRTPSFAGDFSDNTNQVLIFTIIYIIKMFFDIFQMIEHENVVYPSNEFNTLQYRASRIDFCRPPNNFTTNTLNPSVVYNSQTLNGVDNCRVTKIDDVINRKPSHNQPTPPKRTVSCQGLQKSPSTASLVTCKPKIPPPPPPPADLKILLTPVQNSCDKNDSNSFKQAIAQKRAAILENRTPVESTPVKAMLNNSKSSDFDSDLKSAIERRRNCLEKPLLKENAKHNGSNCLVQKIENKNLHISNVRGSATSLKESVVLIQSNSAAEISGRHFKK